MGGQPTNWRTIIAQKCSHSCESSEPRVRLFSLGIQQREGERSGIPRGSDFEGQQDLTVGLPQDLGERNLHSWRTHTKSYMPQDLGERSNDLTGRCIKPCLIVLESLLQTCEAAVTRCRDNRTGNSSTASCLLV